MKGSVRAGRLDVYLTVLVDKPLSFGQIIPHPTEFGTVSVPPNSNNTSTCSEFLTCIRNGDRIVFEVRGEANRAVAISFPGETTITNEEGATMDVSNIAGASGQFTIPASGSQRSGIEGTLTVGPDQDIGIYSGSFEISVEYE